MAKWLLLAAGVFLFFNGMTTRTYSYENPAKHCFQMDYIRVYGCFGNSAAPMAISWGTSVLGGGLVLWSFFCSRRPKT